MSPKVKISSLAAKTLSEKSGIKTAAKTNYKKEVLFTISCHTYIMTAYVVRYKGVLYGITCVNIFKGCKEDLILYRNRRARQ